MNLIVLTKNNNIVTRPDTSIERENREIYLPDFIEDITYSPILFVKICKAGKFISTKFAERYYGDFNYGILMYNEKDMLSGQEGYASASCIDKTSILPQPCYNLVVLNNSDNNFVLKQDKKIIYTTNKGTLSSINEAIEKISKRVSLRIGDIVALELEDRKILLKQEVQRSKISAEYCENYLFDFELIR